MFNLGEMWILAINPTILRHNDARLRYCANQNIPGSWKWRVICSVLFWRPYFGGRSMRVFEFIKGSLWRPPPPPCRRKQKNILYFVGTFF